MSNFTMAQRPASASHDLLLIERAEALALKLRDALQRKGFVIKSAVTPEDALSLSRTMIRPIILFDCGNRSGSRDFLKLFTDGNSLKDYPAIILGRDVDGLADEIYGAFSLISTIKTPCTPTDLLESINYISERYLSGEDARERARAPTAPPNVSSTAASRPQEVPASASPESAQSQDTSDDDPPPPGHGLYEQFDSVATLYFDQLQQAELLKRDLGGALYVKLGIAGREPVEEWRSGDPHIDSLIDSVLSSSGKWGKGHLQRVAFVADRLLSALPLPAETVRDSRIAARIFPLAVNERGRGFLRKEFIGRGTLLVRKELCSWIKDSAFQLATVQRQPAVAEIVATLARMIGREETLSDQPNVISASAIMAAEILDRSCFQSGHWNPRAAHRLLRRITAGKLRDIHPAALCGLAKLLSEALAAGTPAHMLPREIRERSDLLDKARENRERTVSADEAKVNIDELLPGMRLSQPLFAFDGRQLLEENLTLDQDLIWRIWQLSALRPINSPVVIVRKKEIAPRRGDEESADSSSQLSHQSDADSSSSN